MRNFTATPTERLVSELRFMRFIVPEILAGIALAALILLLPIIAAAL